MTRNAIGGDVITEEFKTSGSKVINKIKQIIAAGNARHVILKDEHDHVLMEITLTVAVFGATLAPTLTASGIIAALINKCTITVLKK